MVEKQRKKGTFWTLAAFSGILNTTVIQRSTSTIQGKVSIIPKLQSGEIMSMCPKIPTLTLNQKPWKRSLFGMRNFEFSKRSFVLTIFLKLTEGCTDRQI